MLLIVEFLDDDDRLRIEPFQGMVLTDYTWFINERSVPKEEFQRVEAELRSLSRLPNNDLWMIEHPSP